MRGLQDLIATYDVCITYTALPGEITPSIPDGIETFAIPPHTTLDPLEEAKKVATLSQGRATCLLIPGTAFDALGTRHGRGGGWYDRFLAAVPAEWLRIGMCTNEQFSSSPLKREKWDQPVDYVCIGKSGVLLKTNAR